MCRGTVFKVPSFFSGVCSNGLAHTHLQDAVIPHSKCTIYESYLLFKLRCSWSHNLFHSAWTWSHVPFHPGVNNFCPPRGSWSFWLMFQSFIDNYSWQPCILEWKWNFPSWTDVGSVKQMCNVGVVKHLLLFDPRPFVSLDMLLQYTDKQQLWLLLFGPTIRGCLSPSFSKTCQTHGIHSVSCCQESIGWAVFCVLLLFQAAHNLSSMSHKDITTCVASTANSVICRRIFQEAIIIKAGLCNCSAMRHKETLTIVSGL